MTGHSRIIHNNAMSAVTEPVHLLIADAVPTLPKGFPSPKLPTLTHLDALMAHMRIVDDIEIDETCPATPFEIALARAHHLPGQPGQIPWAAFETHTLGQPCAWLHPCHWQLGLDHVNLVPTVTVDINDAESHALMQAVQTLLAEDSISLTYARADAWLACGKIFKGLTTWSMDRALAQPISRAQLALAPTPESKAHLYRLQTELQMLLYHHPVNEARERSQRWTINALWISGAGNLDQPVLPQPHVQIENRLAQLPPKTSVERRDVVWQAIDTQRIAPLHKRQASGSAMKLTLAGPHRAISYVTPRRLIARMNTWLRPQRLKDIVEKL